MQIFRTLLFGLLSAAFGQLSATEATGLSCDDFQPTEAALERYPNLEGACQGIVERDGELFAEFVALVNHVSTGGGKVELYLPATDHTFTVNPDSGTRVQAGGQMVRPRQLARGQEIRIYLPTSELASPDIDEIALVTENDIIVSHPAAAPGETTDKPGRVLTSLVREGAIVESVDAETREVKLIDASGARFTITADPSIGSLEHLKARDRVYTEYMESIAVVVAPADSEPPIEDSAAFALSTEEDDRSIGGVQTRLVIATLEAIDAENRTATLRTEDGKLTTIPVGEGVPLDLVEIGDQVRFRVTRATAVTIETPED